VGWLFAPFLATLLLARPSPTASALLALALLAAMPPRRSLREALVLALALACLLVQFRFLAPDGSFRVAAGAAAALAAAALLRRTARGALVVAVLVAFGLAVLPVLAFLGDLVAADGVGGLARLDPWRAAAPPPPREVVVALPGQDWAPPPRVEPWPLWPGSPRRPLALALGAFGLAAAVLAAGARRLPPPGRHRRRAAAGGAAPARPGPGPGCGLGTRLPAHPRRRRPAVAGRCGGWCDRSRPGRLGPALRPAAARGARRGPRRGGARPPGARRRRRRRRRRAVRGRLDRLGAARPPPPGPRRRAGGRARPPRLVRRPRPPAARSGDLGRPRRGRPPGPGTRRGPRGRRGRAALSGLAAPPVGNWVEELCWREKGVTGASLARLPRCGRGGLASAGPDRGPDRASCAPGEAGRSSRRKGCVRVGDPCAAGVSRPSRAQFLHPVSDGRLRGPGCRPGRPRLECPALRRPPARPRRAEWPSCDPRPRT